MPIEPLVVGLVLVFGFAAFFLWVIYCLCWVLKKAGEGFIYLFGGGRRFESFQDKGQARVCTNERCRKLEYRDGRYCCQCGAPLQPQRNSVDMCT